MREAHKSGKRESPNILKGDLVLVQDNNLKRYLLECVKAKTGAEIEEEGKNGEECETEGGRCAESPPGAKRLQHAAARDTQCKTRLLLDSF